MTLALSARTLDLALRDPFAIARKDHGSSHTARTVVVELTDDRLPGLTGLGEGFPDRYYGETPATMAAVFDDLLAAAGDPELSPAGLAAASEAVAAAIGGHGAAKCAVDIALHDLVGKALGLTAHELLGLEARIPPTDFSLGIDEPAVVAERARAASRFPALKIKVGGPTDLATLRAVRDVYGGPIRVDANTGWSPDDARALLPELTALGVELIEQPFPAARLDWLADLQRESPLPIVADESIVFEQDLDRLVGVVAGVNVKLAKCGGIGAAARMLHRARGLGFQVFLGCMEETSIAIAASAAVGSFADWVDLDGNLLLADDPFEGIRLNDACEWELSGRPGIGVQPRRQASPEPQR